MVYVLRYGFDYADPASLYLCKRKRLSTQYSITQLEEGDIVPS